MCCRKNPHVKDKIQKNKGVTMVELIVTFALLAIFMTAATMCISHAVIFFFDEQQRMRSYTIADVVLSELKDEIRTMQGSGDDLKGYVKLRNKDSAMPDHAGDTYTGSTIEYVVSNINDGAVAVQVDAAGCNDYMIDAKDEKLREVKAGDDTTNKADLKEGYLTMRYYGIFTETNPFYNDCFMDKIVPGTYAQTVTDFGSVIGKKVVWHAQEKIPEQMYEYNGKAYTVDFQFSVTPRSSGGHDIVDYVDVTVFVKDGGETVYQKSRRVDLQNTVYFNKDTPTMYSDFGS